MNHIEITIPEEVSLRLKPRQIEEIDDDASETSEISMELIAKERLEEQTVNQSSDASSSWNPDGSDYSLDLLRHSNDDDISAADSDRASLMTSDYSLNLKLSQSQHSLKSSQHAAIQLSCSASQHSIATSKSFAKSVDTDITDDETSTKPPSSNSTGRKVNFYPRVRIMRVPNRCSLLKAQVKRVWYNRDEFKDIRQECYETIKMMQEGELVDEEEGFSARGLEYKTQAAYKARQRNKLEIRQVVFEEQQFQQEVGMPDPEWLARVSREQSRSCVEGALEMARRDEEAARAYQRDRCSQ